MTGEIKQLNEERGFGFIRRDGQKKGDRDTFFHASAVKGGGFESLVVGNRVQFDIEKDREGRDRGINVEVVT